MNSVPIRCISYARIQERAASRQHRGLRAAGPVILSIRHNSACPIPRRRCDGSTYMSAHQVAPTASTLRTRPTISSPSSHILAERRVLGEVIAGDGTRSRYLSQPRSQLGCPHPFDRHGRRRLWNAPQRLHEKTFRREQPIAQCLIGGSDRLVRLSPRSWRTRRSPRVCSRTASTCPASTPCAIHSSLR